MTSIEQAMERIINKMTSIVKATESNDKSVHRNNYNSKRKSTEKDIGKVMGGT